MPYAFEGGVSIDQVQGGLQINDEQYRDAIAAMQNGRVVSIDGGFKLIDPAAPPVVTPPPVTDRIPDISDRQFFQALASERYELITEEEAEDAVATGTIPAEMAAMIEALPAEQRFPARMLLRGATQFERENPFVAIFAQAKGLSAQDVDELWHYARAL